MSESVETHVLLGTYKADGRIRRVMMPRGSDAAPVVGTLAYEVATPSAQAAIRFVEDYYPVDVVGLPSRAALLAGTIATLPAPEVDLLVTAGVGVMQGGWGFNWSGSWDE